MLLYIGDVKLTCGARSLTTPGAIVLDVARSELVVEHTPTPAFGYSLAISASICDAIPVSDSPLEPPDTSSSIPDFAQSELINHIVHGSAAAVRLFESYVFGDLTSHMLGDRKTAEGSGSQLSFELLGWHVTVAAVLSGDTRFHVVRATSEDPSDADQLRSALFLLFTLVAGREITVGPCLGRDGSGVVRWVAWGVPRNTTKRNNVRWCPSHLVPKVLPLLAPGLGNAMADPTAALVLQRAIQAVPFASGSEVLDVRVPIICSSIELLAWTVLIRDGWATESSLDTMSAAAMMRLLARWAGIPTEIPDSMSALRGRVNSLGQRGWEAPEVLFNVRNRLVHPPKRFESPEWPTRAELLETWQLSTWFLELILLRLSDYSGPYWSRLRLGRSGFDTELVPWAQGQAADEGPS